MPSKALEYFISTPHWLDAFTPPLEERLTQLAAAVKALLGTIQPGRLGRGTLESVGIGTPTVDGEREVEDPDGLRLRLQPRKRVLNCSELAAD